VSKIPETSFDSSSSGLEAPSSVIDAGAAGIRLVFASHHPLTLCGLSQVFEKERDWIVQAVCTDPEAIVDSLRRHQPDIVILDFDGGGTFKVLRRIQRAHLPTRVVVLASASDSNDMADALRLGASAIVMKELDPEAFVASVRKVHRGERSTGEPTDGDLVSKLFKNGPSMRRFTRQLTPRETEIARLAVLGIPTREIAERLDVKQGTVKIHLHSIYEKLNVGGRLGLVLFARRHGLA
jgi:DNA-binding NarL/FixJ family response regulator